MFRHNSRSLPGLWPARRTPPAHAQRVDAPLSDNSCRPASLIQPTQMRRREWLGRRPAGRRASWLRRHLYPFLQSLLRFGRKPPLQRCIATISRRYRLGGNTGLFAHGAKESDMEVVVVAPPRSNLPHPRAVGGHRLAQNLMAGLTKIRSTCGSKRLSQQSGLPRSPIRCIDASSPSAETIEMADTSSRSTGAKGRRRRLEPDVDIQADLVVAMAGRHRPSCGSAIADQYAASHSVHIRGQALDEGDVSGMPEVTVAGGTHHLPTGPIEWQGFGAGEAAATGTADCTRRRWRRSVQLSLVRNLR